MTTPATDWRVLDDDDPDFDLAENRTVAVEAQNAVAVVNNKEAA